MRSDKDTIYALSSGGLPSGVAVLRLSGDQSRFALETLTGPLPPARHAALRTLRFAGVELDRGLVLWFPGPASFTGEDMAELHVHGGPAVVAACTGALAAMPGLRGADAGEFSRRAFLTGKLDLTAIEGLADLIAAETEQQRRQAVAQSGGALRRLVDDWRARIVRMRALIEAELDFPDEDDVPGSVADRIWSDAAALADDIDKYLVGAGGGEILRRGLEVVLLGAPNSGKSSLLNALARRDAAIVTPEPGTTRDPIEVRLDLAGYPVTVVDTAGLRQGGGAIEREGIRRARLRGASADVILWLTAPDVALDAASNGDAGPPVDLGPVPQVRVRTKLDLGGEPGVADLAVSVVTGQGLMELEARLAELAGRLCGRGEDAVIARARHREALAQTAARLHAASGSEGPLELRAEDLRQAGDALGRLTGAIGPEDLLDVIFREFCIGK